MTEVILKLLLLTKSKQNGSLDELKNHFAQNKWKCVELLLKKSRRIIQEE